MKLLVPIFILISNCIIAQLNMMDSEGRKQGAWEKYWDESKTLPQYKGQFVNDEPVGEFWYYYPSGEVRAIIDHLNPNQSFASFYFKNKELMSEGMYLNQKRDSLWINYNPQGFTLSIEKYKDGKLNGTKVIFYIQNQIERGELKVLSETMYIDSLRSGSFKEYFSSGILKEEGSFLNDRREGIWTKFNIKGARVQSLRYKNGVKHGWSYSYNGQDESRESGLYRNGELLMGEERERYLNDCKLKGIDPND